MISCMGNLHPWVVNGAHMYSVCRARGNAGLFGQRMVNGLKMNKCKQPVFVAKGHINCGSIPRVER